MTAIAKARAFAQDKSGGLTCTEGEAVLVMRNEWLNLKT
jgi:hypothetical protein